MPKPALLITRQLPDAVAARAGERFDARLNQPDVHWSPNEIVELATGADAILCFSTDRLNADTIAALPASVKAIATCSVGYDHIDLAAARARFIPVANTPEVLSVATAEIAMLLILMSARRAGEDGGNGVEAEIAHRGAGLGCGTAHVRQQDDVLDAEIAGVEVGLAVIDVEAGEADLAGAQGGLQRGIIDQRSAGGVGDDGTARQHGQAVGVEPFERAGAAGRGHG